MLTVTRAQPGKFVPQHIQLLQTFADQAVIAIQNARLFNETKEALERQTATSEILKVIAASPADTAPVFEAIAQSANTLLGGLSTTVWRFEGEIGRLAAFTPTNPEADAALRPLSPLPVRDLAAFVLLKGGEIAQLPDTEEGPEALRDLARLRGYRAMLFVPLIQRGEAVGFVSVTRARAGAFDPGEVDLLKTFADQAVIAIQNAQLFNETQEALERQQASAEILSVISSSPTDVKPVFDAIGLTAGRLFDCQMSAVFRAEGASLKLVTTAVRDRLLTVEELPPSVPIDPRKNYPSVAFVERRTLYMRDFSDPKTPEHERAVSSRFGFSSALYMPLMCAGGCIGVFVLTAAKTQAFNDNDVALAESFRDQAQIALENTRLFGETQEALEQLKASADILGVISNSVADAKPVFDKILLSAKHLFGGDELDVLLVDVEGQLTIGAYLGDHHDIVARTFPAPLERTPAGKAIRERKAAHWPDLVNGEDVPNVLRKMAKLIGYGSMVFAPMLNGERGVGAIGVARSTGPFKPKELAMLQTFADQAVVAIENARLFAEVQARTRDVEEALAQQTATADVLKVISQ